MTENQRIRQMQACHATFKRYQSEGMIPVAISLYDYALSVIGRRVESLKKLSDVELNALRDRLEGKENKGLLKLHDAARLAGIEDLAGWMKSNSAHEGFAYLRGYTPEMLPFNFQWRLTNCLLARVSANQRPKKPRVAEPMLF